MGIQEVKMVSVSALKEAKKVIENLNNTNTISGRYMASGGNVILEILGLLDEDTTQIINREEE